MALTPMLRPLLVAVALGSCAATAAASPELPLPPELEPNVRFWTRVYTEVDSKGGLIHDSEHLDVVYEVVRLRNGLSARAQERRTEARKRHYRDILRRLATGKRTGLTPDEDRVLSRWPEGTSNATLRAASKRLRFQLGQADRFRAGLVRSGHWIDHIEQTLREQAVPIELAALPHVESSFNPKAYSRVGAAGLWQFTRSTGRRYLRIDDVVDERMDPYKASAAAGRLLRDNYKRLGVWPLAITAYNHGVAGMGRAVRRTGSNDIGVISRRYKSRTFGFASRNFYAEFLAASEIHHNPQRYFGALRPADPIPYEILITDHYYAAPTLERALGIDRELLRDHNLALRPAVWNGAKYVPKGYALHIPRHALQKPIGLAMASIPDAERIARQQRDRFHKVRRGETLGRIARRYGVSERELVHVNNLRSRHRIRVGQILRLPSHEPIPAPVVVARSEPPVDGVYVVRRGDTLSRIATRFGTSESELVALNSLRNRHRIAVGQRLRVTAEPELRVASLVASLPSESQELADPTLVPAPRMPPPDGDSAPDAPAEAPEDGRVARTPAPEATAPEGEDTGSGGLLALLRRLGGAPARTPERAPEPPAEVTVAQVEPAPVPDGTSPAALPEDELQRPAGEPTGDASGRYEAGPSPAEGAPGPQPLEIARAPQPEPRELAREPEPQPRELARAPEPGWSGRPQAGEPVPDADAEPIPDPTGLPDPSAVLVEEEFGNDPPASATIRTPGQSPSLEAGALPPPDPSDFSVTPDHRITVQADETLGHYAEWLEVPASRLRRLNGMRYGQSLVIGRRKKLDFSRVTPELFEERRLEYHRTLQEEFFDAYIVSGTRTHTLRKGDTLWDLARRRYQVPMWLLRQYNADLDFGALNAGTRLVIPVIEPRTEG